MRERNRYGILIITSTRKSLFERPATAHDLFLSAAVGDDLEISGCIRDDFILAFTWTLNICVVLLIIPSAAVLENTALRRAWPRLQHSLHGWSIRPSGTLGYMQVNLAHASIYPYLVCCCFTGQVCGPRFAWTLAV